MLTGRQPITTGVLGNRSWFGREHPEFVSLPKHFRANGYVTLRAGKIFHGGIDDEEAWSEGGEARIYGRSGAASAAPFAFRAGAANAGVMGMLQDRAATLQDDLTRAQRSDRWIVLPGDGEGNEDYRVADQAIEFLRAHQDGTFFLGCGFSKPHSPLEAPQRFFDLYDVDQIELPPDFAPRPTVPDGFPRLSIRPRNADLFVARDATPGEAKEMTRAYLASLSWMDWNVGRVLAELDRLKLREKTIIVFWGDHGYQLGEKGKWSKAGSLFEQGARVPLVILAPGAAGNGKPSPRVVESIDLYPTLCELAGIPPAEGLAGRSLVPLLTNPNLAWDHPAYTIWSEDGNTLQGVSVRTERWRYTEFDGGRGGALLTDPQSDPFEMRNRADDQDLADVRKAHSELVRGYAAKYQPK
jgi:arylsulfatase A-like enzyme